MQHFELKQTARMVKLALVPAACFSLLASCATYYDEPATAPAAPVASARTLPPPGVIERYHAVRAGDLIGKPVSTRQGESLGRLADLIVQLGTGQVAYAVVSSPANGRDYILPAHAMNVASDGGVVLDMAHARLADYRSFTAWPDMQDTAYWSAIDRASGFPPVQPGHGYDRLSQLRGKLVADAHNAHVGRVEDLVINTTGDVVHYAVVALEPGVPGGARLVAVPLSAFMFPREGTNRLALDMDESRLAQLETFDATRWARINEPAYVAHIDRYFVQAFPVAGAAFFDRLDTNRDGFLSRAELSPLLAAGTDRYVVEGPDATMASFHAYDINHDGFLDRTEASAVLPAGASFEHYDTNRDGFLSMAEAMPVLASVHAPRMASLTFDQLDADRDGFVSRTEAERLVAVPGVATTRQAMVVAPAPSFDAYDVDRDGYLNRAEAASMLRHYGGTAAFDRYDANRDGFLSKAEVDALVSHNVGTSATEPGSGTLRGTR